MRLNCFVFEAWVCLIESRKSNKINKSAKPLGPSDRPDFVFDLPKATIMWANVKFMLSVRKWPNHFNGGD